MAVFLALLLLPMPESLGRPGQVALAVVALVVVLWVTEVSPHRRHRICLGVLLLALLGGVPDFGDALYGFSQPVAYFLLGILTLGLAVRRSGLAERMAIYLIRGAGGSPAMLYVQMLFSFAALTFALPSASTRGAIMVHVYERVMERWSIPRSHPFKPRGDAGHGFAQPAGVHRPAGGWRHALSWRRDCWATSHGRAGSC